MVIHLLPAGLTQPCRQTDNAYCYLQATLTSPLFARKNILCFNCSVFKAKFIVMLHSHHNF